MKADVLLQNVTVFENGTLLKACSGLLILTWHPGANDVQAVNPCGRKIELRDNNTITIAKEEDKYAYRKQLELRATITGKSWIHAEIISTPVHGLVEKLIDELKEVANKSLPFGSSLLDQFADYVKKGMIQVIASGESEYFSSNDIPKHLTIPLNAPKQVIVEIPKPYPEEGPPDRKVLLGVNSPNGTIELEVVKA